MVTYSIEPIEDVKVFDNLYKHYPRGQKEMYEWVRNRNCAFVVAAKIDNEIIGSLGIKVLSPGNYRYLHLTVYPEHQYKGIGTTILRESVKLLTERGAHRIENHKRENMIRHDIFIEMGFKLQSIRNVDGEKYTTYVLNIGA